jgi:cell division inhibitor SulA
MELLNKSGLISEEAIEKIQKRATDVSCQCPGQLVDIFRQIQAFTEYQQKCLNQKPQDEMIHKWLQSTSVNLEHILSNSIITLARLEGMIDENNQIIED